MTMHKMNINSSLVVIFSADQRSLLLFFNRSVS